jgi:GAF domain-containing protein
MNPNHKLVCQSGVLRGVKWDMPTRRLAVGRDPSCDLRIDDPKISRIHGYLEMTGGALTYKDNNSTNGSFLNGQRFMGGPLKLGDSLQLGSCEFVLLEESDFQTINFVSSQSQVTTSLATKSVSADELAQKFSQIFDYYKEHAPEAGDYDDLDIVRMQRMLNSLKTLFSIGNTMTKVLPMTDLLALVTDKLFEVCSAAENVVVLLAESGSSPRPVHAATRGSRDVPEMQISRTVLDRAVAERATLMANDAGSDARLAASESILGLQVKAVLCAPLVVGGDRVLGALYIDNRSLNSRFDDFDVELVTAFANQAAIAVDNARLYEDLQKYYHQTLQALVNAVEAKDPYTMGHTQRVAKLSVTLGREMGLTGKRLERLKMAAELHDIGKIGVKETLINKPGRLTDDEYEEVKMHVEMGEMILKPITFLHDLLPHIRGHHERWDGSGYPDGLKGEETTLEGRIIGLADAFDAMTSQRTYNKPLSLQEATTRIKESSGRHFDPVLVEHFVRMMDRMSGTGESVRPDDLASPTNLPVSLDVRTARA